MKDFPTNLTDMNSRHKELWDTFCELNDLWREKKLSDAAMEIANEFLFGERQKVYEATALKVAANTEELTAQVDTFVREATGDHVHISLAEDYHGQMLRSIRAGIKAQPGPERNEERPEQFFDDFASLSQRDKDLVLAFSGTLRGIQPALKATG